MCEHRPMTLHQLLRVGVAEAYLESMNKFWGMPDRNIEEQWRDSRMIIEMVMPQHNFIREESIPLGCVEYGP